jgi:hypothetical protein
MLRENDGEQQAPVGSYGEMEEQNQKLEELQGTYDDVSVNGRVKRLLWHGGSVYDAWFSAASNQVHLRFLLLHIPPFLYLHSFWYDSPPVVGSSTLSDARQSFSQKLQGERVMC